MKNIKYTLLCLHLFICSVNVQAQVSKTAVVDASDTIFFDLSNAVVTSSYIDLPVSIITDDTVYALDFSMKYNYANLDYDTVFDLASYLLSLTFYNTNDSTLRYTSSSLTAISHDTPLVMVRFNLLSGSMSLSDLFALKGYLNGNACSVKWSGVLAGINDLAAGSLHLFPNPASLFAMLQTDNCRNCEVDVYNLGGQKMQSVIISKTYANQVRIDTSALAEGLYIVTLKSEGGRRSELLEVLK